MIEGYRESMINNNIKEHEMREPARMQQFHPTQEFFLFFF